MLGGMTSTIPSSDELRAKLSALGHAELMGLAERTATPFTTLWKIRSGETANPRLETVRAIWPELIGTPAPDTPAADEQAA